MTDDHVAMIDVSWWMFLLVPTHTGCKMGVCVCVCVWERSYSSCMQSRMLYSSETCPVRKEMRWHFSARKWEWSYGCVTLR